MTPALNKVDRVSWAESSSQIAEVWKFDNLDSDQKVQWQNPRIIAKPHPGTSMISDPSEESCFITLKRLVHPGSSQVSLDSRDRLGDRLSLDCPLETRVCMRETADILGDTKGLGWSFEIDIEHGEQMGLILNM